MTLRRRLLAIGALSLVSMLSACATRSGSSAGVARSDPPPTYAEVATKHNARAARLTRLWANATVQFSYLDEEGDRHSEQGEGHLQFRAPDEFALSVGKISEVLFWIGSDHERFWFFQLYEGSRASIGRHDNLGKPCSRGLGLPASPADIIDLLGITPLPEDAPGATSWSLNGKYLVVDAPGRLAWRRLFLDPKTSLPVRIELYDPDDTEAPVVIATIEENDRVELEGVGGFMPRAPSRVQIDHPASETSIRLFLHNLNDGKTNDRLPDEAFDFRYLVEAFAPKEVVVLDADCPAPALRVGER